MNENEIENIDIKRLLLDDQNPRLSEFGVGGNSNQREIINTLWNEMAVDELMYSIVSNGFWQYEPLAAIRYRDSDQYIVIEGNRRLAAVKLIHDHTLIDARVPAQIKEKFSEEIINSTQKLPVMVVKSRGDLWGFIGFKHVNGPAKWGSYAKAKYVAEIHNTQKVPLDDIAYNIGDTNKTVQRLYQGLMVLEQAKDEGIFSYDDVKAPRLYFSHLYTGLQREGIKSYLHIQKAEEESTTPVPNEYLNKLRRLLEWLYGSKQKEIEPVIKSQNPDLTHLDKVLKNIEATAHLQSGSGLEAAYEYTFDSDSLFEDCLVTAKRNLQKARGYLTNGYDGDENLLKVAGSVANLAEDLYDEMEKKSRSNDHKTKSKRLTD